MDLAKPALDVGLYTSDIDAHLRFWQDEVGLPYQELLKAGRGVHQHRLGLHGAVLKVNSAKGDLGGSPTALLGVTIASEAVDAPARRSAPDGIAVELVPPGHDGIDATELRLATADPATARRWWVDGLGAVEEGEGRYRVGETRIAVEHRPGQPRTGGLRDRGLRYLTVQIRDVEAEHARLLALGFEEASSPIRLGDVAYISFVRDPDGGWLELSQRASLTGALPEGARRR